jgi:hypothetical protein
MAMNPKRKGSGSQAESATAKRARWEDELATPPSETSPTAALISGVPSAHIHGGSYTVIGSNVQNTYHIHGPQPSATDILDILRNLPLPNFRDIQLDTLSKATDGTCIAVTAGEMFLYWIKKGRILWGIGIRASSFGVDVTSTLTDRASWSREDRPIVSGLDQASICELTFFTQSHRHSIPIRARERLRRFHLRLLCLPAIQRVVIHSGRSRIARQADRRAPP